MHVFNVEETQGVVQVITLRPKEMCSCPTGGTCFHIMAAQLSIGMKEIPKSKERDFQCYTRQLRIKVNRNQAPIPSWLLE